MNNHAQAGKHCKSVAIGAKVSKVDVSTTMENVQDMVSLRCVNKTAQSSGWTQGGCESNHESTAFLGEKREVHVAGLTMPIRNYNSLMIMKR